MPATATRSGKTWAIAVALLAVSILSVTPFLDQRALANYESLFQRALVTFALARTLNGVISAVQGTELALQPAGIGVTLTPGELLDPINDLVERFSWIMLGATVSLGIQQVLLEISAWWLVQGLVVALAVWLLALYWTRGGVASTHQRVVLRALLVALFLRFAVPLTLIANDLVYQVFLEPRYVSSTEVIEDAGKDISALSEREPQAEVAGDDEYFLGSIIGSMGRAMRDTADGLDLSERVKRITERARDMVEHLIQLAVVFILQTGLLPILFLWLFLQGAKRLFRPFGVGPDRRRHQDP